MSRRRSARSRRSKTRKRSSTVLRGLFAGFAVVAALTAGYLIYLDRVITSTFEGRRWSVPAQVYAQPLELYPGQRLSAGGLETELKRLGYQAVANPGRPGSYRRDGGELRMVLRRFEFSDGVRDNLALRVRFRGDVVQQVHSGAGEPVGLARVEPALIGSFFPSHGEDRLIIAPDEMPVLLTETLKAVEDRAFDRHHGFDLRGILRAFWTNLRAGAVQQGGSTLTQQLVKSYFLDNRRTLSRKLQELAMAVILELRFDKQDLLSAYVNEIYIGQDGNRAVHGFGLASQFYFNKPVDELSAAETALLVGVIRGPSYYNPFRRPERAVARRDLVLNLMHEFELIDEQALANALSTPMQLSSAHREGGRYYPAFMDLVRRQLDRDYDRDQLATRGLRIFTTLNPRTQETAERAVAQTLAAIERQRDLPAGELQAAVIVTHTQTGEVEAVVGGRRPGFQGFNYALNARRPVGSLIKPVIYLSAIESTRFNLASIIDDAPVTLSMPNQVDWQPGNFSEETYGPVPLVRALGDSLNLATVHLGLDVGVDTIAQRLGAMQDRAPPSAYPSLLLGALDMSPIEVSGLYGIFASGGFAADTKAIVAVEDREGDRISQFPMRMRQAADPDHIAQLNHALAAVMRHGTGRSSQHSASDVAGKTGTSGEFRDSWFVGFDAARLTVVWVGYGDGRSSRLTGATGAMPVWDALMSELTVSPLVLPVPRGHRLQVLDYAAGLRSGEPCTGLVVVPLPDRERLAAKAGCNADNGNVLERIKSWFGN